MRWRTGRRSANVEDRRGRGAGLAIGGGLTTLIALAIALLFGADPRTLLEQVGTTEQVPQGEYVGTPQEEELKEFVSVVLGHTEEVWHELFRESGMAYQEPILVLFTDQVQSACGIAGAAVGPFYCSQDHRLYIDLGFYDELRRRFGAPGDFAQAYVIAHEVGHHVQNLLGTLEEVHRARSGMNEREANALSVRLELQADYLAGVWAHYAQQQGLLEEGDIEEALNAASAIGDDRLQKQTQGRVVPDAFTHGTSEQRVEWFRRGFRSGDPSGGDTFNAPDL